jgi:RNA polymerase sigma-70 factor (ECF subfamily)
MKIEKYHKTVMEVEKEREIILKAQNNPENFAPLYDEYFLPIFKYAIKRVNDENMASEITSEIFAKALFKLKQFKFKGFPFSSWLFQIARNEIIDFYRKNNSSKYLRVSEKELNYLVDSSDEDILTNENKEFRISQILTGLKDLIDEEIELIELRYFEDRSFKEIGEILNITDTNARVKTHRAITKLKVLLKK